LDVTLDSKRIEFPDNRLLLDLCGVCDRNLNQIEEHLGIQIVPKGNSLILFGPPEQIDHGHNALTYLYDRIGEGHRMDDISLEEAMVTSSNKPNRSLEKSDTEMFHSHLEIVTRRRVIKPKSVPQENYVKNLFRKKIAFGIGPAGTGKTYLAVAVAVASLLNKEVDRIVLTRPAVEAGERLGFLPGDLRDKIDPFMQPLYDALNEFLPSKMVSHYLDENKIEIAPLAFMRGRTLTRCFIILDEAQNTTNMQMLMLLTRLGIGSRMAIAGDISQIDFVKKQESGLLHARKILQGINGISFSELTSKDVMRSKIVSDIIDAYAQQKP